MTHKRLLWPALAAACLATAACSSSGGADAHKPVPATNATTAHAPLLPTDAQALPDFSYSQYQQLLGQLKGTPVVVNLWGSWCGPCRREAPLLKQAAATYGDRVQFIGVDILDAKPSARTYMDEFGLTFPSIFDPSGGGEIRNSLGYIGQPDTVFYNAAGDKVDEWQGEISEARLKEGINKILAGAASPSAS